MQSYSQKQDILRGGKCLQTPELKILCLSVFYIVCGVVVLAQYGETTGSQGNYVQRVIDFAVCHLAGESSATVDCPSHDNIMDSKVVALNCLSYLMLGCLPISSLIFAFKSSDFNQVAVCCK